MVGEKEGRQTSMNTCMQGEFYRLRFWHEGSRNGRKLGHMRAGRVRSAEDRFGLLHYDRTPVHLLHITGTVLAFAFLPGVGRQFRICRSRELVRNSLGIVIGGAGSEAFDVTSGGGFCVCGEHRIIRYSLRARVGSG